MHREHKLNVLLVDDDATDRELFLDAIRLAGKSYQVSEVSNGEEAIQYLNETQALPHLIILDLNMPVKDGRETLKEIKEHQIFKSIPVCVMSTSSSHFDISHAYLHGANLFLVKPMDFKELIEMSTHLLNLFSKFVTLYIPKRSTGE